MPWAPLEKCPQVVRKRPQVFIAVICALALLTVIIIHFGFSRSKPAEPRSYTLVVDAGSTSTKMSGYKFYKNPANGSLVLDDDEFYETVKKGLANSVNNPKEVEEIILELLGKAEKFVPKELWSTTPLIMRATAGFRKLNDDQIQQVFKEVEKVFAKSEFYKPKIPVAMLSGDDEGIFGWVAVNFLLDTIHRKVTDMSAALDLGGASTQVTFPLANDTLSQSVPSDHLHNPTIHGRAVKLYSHSYMGLGLQESKRKILTMGSPEGTTNLTSECVTPSDNGTVLKFDGVDYTFHSPPEFEISKCEQLVKEFVASSQITKPPGAHQFKIISFSGFYYKANDAGLLGKNGEENTFTVQQLEDSWKSICLNPQTKLPMLCLEVMYVSTLLVDGYGFPAELKLTALKKLKGHTVNWALGVASQTAWDKI